MISIILQSGLFIWYVYSLYDVSIDTTLSLPMKILYEVIGLLTLGYIVSNMSNQNHSFLFYELGLIGICWYFYSTYRDYTTIGYTLSQRISYVAIDVATLIYIIGTLILAMYGVSHKFAVSEQINNISHFKFGLI